MSFRNVEVGHNWDRELKLVDVPCRAMLERSQITHRIRNGSDMLERGRDNLCTPDYKEINKIPSFIHPAVDSYSLLNLEDPETKKMVLREWNGWGCNALEPMFSGKIS